MDTEPVKTPRGLLPAIRTFPRRQFVKLLKALDWRGSPVESVKISAKYVWLWFEIHLSKGPTDRTGPTLPREALGSV
jgi:hypothetical protein